MFPCSCPKNWSGRLVGEYCLEGGEGGSMWQGRRHGGVGVKIVGQNVRGRISYSRNGVLDVRGRIFPSRTAVPGGRQAIFLIRMMQNNPQTN